MAAEPEPGPGAGPDPELEELLETLRCNFGVRLLGYDHWRALPGSDFDVQLRGAVFLFSGSPATSKPPNTPKNPPSKKKPQKPQNLPFFRRFGRLRAQPPRSRRPSRSHLAFRRLRRGLAVLLAGEIFPGAVRGRAGGAGGGGIPGGHAGAGPAGAPARAAVPEALGSCRKSRLGRRLPAGIHLVPQGDAERAGPERQRPPELPWLGGGAGEGPGGAGAGRGRRGRGPARHAQHHGVPAVQGRAVPLPQGDHRQVPGVAAAARGVAVPRAAGAFRGAAGAHGAHLRRAGAGAAGGARGAAEGEIREPSGNDAAAAGPGPPPEGAGRGHAPRPAGAAGGALGGAVPPHVGEILGCPPPQNPQRPRRG